MAKIKTVGELIEALKAFDPKLPVGVYVGDAEEGGAFVSSIVHQKALPDNYKELSDADKQAVKDKSTMLYHKGDNPISPIMQEYNDGIKELVTICTNY
jgi:hypothetical protein